MDQTLDKDAVGAARERIAPHVRTTPVIAVSAGELGDHPPLSLKLELLQHTGSFKARGAFNNLIAREIPPAGVAAASGGNHGAAVAFAAAKLGIKAKIFVPEISSPAKVAKIRAVGGDVVVKGDRYADALAECEAYMAATGAVGVHAYEAVETMAGQGTIALEWNAQAGDLDIFLVAVGGGGLIGGMATWLDGAARLVAVETKGTAAYHDARRAGRPVDVDVSGIAADSLGAKQIGSLAFAALQKADADAVLVTDEDVRAAQRVLWDRLRLVAEPGGATALAAILSGAWQPPANARIGVLICGGNADPAFLSDS